MIWFTTLYHVVRDIFCRDCLPSTGLDQDYIGILVLMYDQSSVWNTANTLMSNENIQEPYLDCHLESHSRKDIVENANKC